MKTLTKIMPALGLSAAALLTATPAQAVNDFGSAAPALSYTPQYVHDAYASGYASEGECNATVSGLEDKIDALRNARYSENDLYGTTACWQRSDSRWTYGSLGFSLSSKADLPKMNGYRVYSKPAGNIYMHDAGDYSSMDECNTYRTSILNNLKKMNATILQAPACGWDVNWDLGIQLAPTYLGITYTTSNNARMMTSDRFMATTPYIGNSTGAGFGLAGGMRHTAPDGTIGIGS